MDDGRITKEIDLEALLAIIRGPPLQTAEEKTAAFARVVQLPIEEIPAANENSPYRGMDKAQRFVCALAESSQVEDTVGSALVKPQSAISKKIFTTQTLPSVSYDDIKLNMWWGILRHLDIDALEEKMSKSLSVIESVCGEYGFSDISYTYFSINAKVKNGEMVFKDLESAREYLPSSREQKKALTNLSMTLEFSRNVGDDSALHRQEVSCNWIYGAYSKYLNLRVSLNRLTVEERPFYDRLREHILSYAK